MFKKIILFLFAVLLLILKPIELLLQCLNIGFNWLMYRYWKFKGCDVVWTGKKHQPKKPKFMIVKYLGTYTLKINNTEYEFTKEDFVELQKMIVAIAPTEVES